MRSGELAGAIVIAVVGGGYIGLVIDRWRKAPPPGQLPKRYVNDVRLSRMHVIEDESFRSGYVHPDDSGD